MLEQCVHWVGHTFHLLSISPFHSNAAWTIREIEQKEDWTPNWIIYGVTVNEHITENDCEWLLLCERQYMKFYPIMSEHRRETPMLRNSRNGWFQIIAGQQVLSLCDFDNCCGRRASRANRIYLIEVLRTCRINFIVLQLFSPVERCSWNELETACPK